MSSANIAKSPMQEAFTWIWDTFGEPIVKGGVVWSWKAAQWKVAADRYGDRLVQDYGKLFVLGQPEPKDIDDIYTYVNVLEKLSAFKRHGREQLLELYMQRGLWREQKERRDGLKMVQKGNNLFILGQPGAGKTTFLKQVTIRAAQEKMMRTIDNQLRRLWSEAVQSRLQETKEVVQIPVFISLKAHADSGRTLLASIEHELQVCRFPDAAPFVQLLLKSGRALILWDGLDEVSQDGNQRGKLIGEMRAFMRQYRESQFIITCRVAATEYSFDNVNYLEMADFDKGQMNTFIHRWFEDRNLADQCWSELQKAENRGLRELARTPLLLTLLAITYEETMTFPQRRVEIYEEAIDALLTKRRIQRGEEPYKALSLGRKRQMLARIGAETFDKGEFILPQRRLAELIEAYMQKLPGVKDEIDGEVILRAIAARHGIFVERSQKLYSFAHLSFQEYFAAKFIVGNTRQYSLEHLLDHIATDQWRELFLLTSSLLNEADADDFFILFVKRLNEMVATIESVQHWLKWAQEKENHAHATMKSTYRPVSLRAWHLARDHALTRDLVLNFAHTITRTHALNRARDLDHNLSLDLDLDRVRNLDLDRARDRTHDLDLDLVRERDLDHILTLNHTIWLCKELGLADLGQTFERLVWPKSDAPMVQWEVFAKAIDVLINEFRDLSGIVHLQQWDEKDEQFLNAIKWDGVQVDIYTQYLKGTALLIDCLQLAAVSDRTGIEERLLLPASSN